MWKLATALRGGSGVGWTTQTALSAISYPYFERLVWQRFGRDIEARRFDVVHRITPLTPTAPSPLATRCAKAGVPFVLGPLNGGVPWPEGFGASRRKEREWLSYVRGAHRWLPGWRRTFADASAVLAGSRFTLNDLMTEPHSKYLYLPENGIDPDRFSKRAEPYRGGVLKICFVGRLVPYKGADMLLEAAAQMLASGAARLDVVGDGPMLPAIARRVQELGLEHAVTLHGWVAHDKVQDILCQSHLMALPSVREFGGGVVLEAMALGVVPLVVDYAGPGELVDDSVGLKVPIGDRTAIVDALRRTLAAVPHDPASMGDRSRRAAERVRAEFTWQAKARRVLEVYRSVLAPGRSPIGTAAEGGQAPA
jgi:glycosyltransferase involved in cell wall biosynthesis